MYLCRDCGEMFSDPASVRFCYEVDCGISGTFDDLHYGSYYICPECGSENLSESCCDGDCGDCGLHDDCTLPERNEGNETETEAACP